MCKIEVEKIITEQKQILLLKKLQNTEPLLVSFFACIVTKIKKELFLHFCLIYEPNVVILLQNQAWHFTKKFIRLYWLNIFQ